MNIEILNTDPNVIVEEGIYSSDYPLNYGFTVNGNYIITINFFLGQCLRGFNTVQNILVVELGARE